MMTPTKARHALQSSPRRSLAARDAWRAFKRWLYWFHRWLGVVTCLFCVMWFATGLVMLYVPFPSWSDAERVAVLPPIDIAAVRVMPDAALSKSGTKALPDVLRLEMFAGEPVYRIMAGAARVSLSAATGEAIVDVSREQAEKHVALTFPNTRPSFDHDVDADQWTPTRRFDPHRPLHRFSLNDDAGSVVYVSSKTGEIVQNATFAERAWNWVGAVPHWIYFTPIRRDQEFWRQAVMWLSGPLVIGAISGVWIGTLRMRAKAPAKGHSISPYRGWMKWHHIAGLIGGVFLTTWIFSGWLSVNPFHWFARTQLTDQQTTAYAARNERSIGLTSDALKSASGSTEISFAWIAGHATMLARSPTSTRLLHPATGVYLQISDTELIDAAKAMYPAHQVTTATHLERETLYWYSHHDERPLPALQISFDDPQSTSIYIDLTTAQVAGLSDRSARANRWLFDFLHDYDLPVLLRNRPARDILIWLLSIAGLVISISGVVIGWRTLKRQFQ